MICTRSTRSVYNLLRYGVKVKEDVRENNVTVHLIIDWKNPRTIVFITRKKLLLKAPRKNVRMLFVCQWNRIGRSGIKTCQRFLSPKASAKTSTTSSIGLSNLFLYRSAHPCRKRQPGALVRYQPKHRRNFIWSGRKINTNTIPIRTYLISISYNFANQNASWSSSMIL